MFKGGRYFSCILPFCVPLVYQVDYFHPFRIPKCLFFHAPKDVKPQMNNKPVGLILEL